MTLLPVLTPWPVLLEALAHKGLDLSGVAGTPDGSVVVVGNGGGSLWERFVAWLATRPELLQTEPHPLDRYVAEAIAELPAHASRRWVLSTDPTLPIRQLALEAGLGWRSRLGLLLHPTFGPWVGLRAVCFTSERLPPTGALPGPGPCHGCPAPCVTACPGRAVTERGFDVRACAETRLNTSLCAHTCRARDACPVGAAHRYPELAVRYHHDPVTGRTALAGSLGLEAGPGAQGDRVARDWASVLRS